MTYTPKEPSPEEKAEFEARRKRLREQREREEEQRKRLLKDTYGVAIGDIVEYDGKLWTLMYVSDDMGKATVKRYDNYAERFEWTTPEKIKYVRDKPESRAELEKMLGMELEDTGIRIELEMEEDWDDSNVPVEYTEFFSSMGDAEDSWNWHVKDYTRGDSPFHVNAVVFEAEGERVMVFMESSSFYDFGFDEVVNCYNDALESGESKAYL